MIQEKLFQEFLNKRGEIARQSGFLARFLVCWPASTQGFRYLSLYDPVWGTPPEAAPCMNELLEAATARRASVTLRAGRCRSRQMRRTCSSPCRTMSSRSCVMAANWRASATSASKSMEIVGRMAGIMHHFDGIAGDVIASREPSAAQEIIRTTSKSTSRCSVRALIYQDQKDMRCAGQLPSYRVLAQTARTAPAQRGAQTAPIQHQGRFEIAIQRHIAVGNHCPSCDNRSSRRAVSGSTPTLRVATFADSTSNLSRPKGRFY